MITRRDSTLTHTPPEGRMSHRLSQHLELSVSSCSKLHIKNAPFWKEQTHRQPKPNVRGISFVYLEEDYQRKQQFFVLLCTTTKGAHAKNVIRIRIRFPAEIRPIKRENTSHYVCCVGNKSLWWLFILSCDNTGFSIKDTYLNLRIFIQCWTWIWWNKVSAAHTQDFRGLETKCHPPSCHHTPTHPPSYLLFCFHNSILSRQYLLWPVPAAHRAFYKYKAWAQAL